ncbi:MAG: DUF3108 domain-containing protein [Pseudomonadota bacterium]|nr:DUF3108 domain-containing protein [Pseudomonadota bacterium]
MTTKPLATVRRGILAGGAITAAMLAGPATAATELDYVAYYGGLEAVRVTARVDITGARYHITSDARSSGFLDWMFPFQARVDGHGATDRPWRANQYNQTSVYRGNRRRISLARAADGALEEDVRPPVPIEDRDPVPPALRRTGVNPLAALAMAASKPAVAEACANTLPIYNGKARTDWTLRYLGPATLKGSRHAPFDGAAERCLLTFEVLAGGYKKSWFGEDQPPPEVEIWLAKAAGPDFWVPVRLRLDTELATIFWHLIDWRQVP